MRRLILTCLAAYLAFGLGCQRKTEGPAPNAEQNTPTPVAPEKILARFHFKGFDHLATGTNASTLQEIWKLAETGTMRAMALEKLGPSLLNLFADASTPTHTNQAALLRPLLEDLLRSESVFEMVERANRLPAWTLAVRPDESRQDLWRENSDKLIQRAQATGGSFLFSGRLTNGWVAFAFDSGASGSTTNTPLWREVGSLPASVPSPHWLRADADWPRLTNAIPAWSWLALPAFDFTVQGKGDGLRTEAHLHYAKAPNWPLESWQLPTNTIRDPLISFTTMRGFGPWLKNQAWFQKLGLSSVPNQLVAWGQSDTLFQIQLAVPVDDATNELKHLATNWIPLVNSNLLGSPLDPFQFHTNVAQISTRMLLLVPFVRVTGTHGRFLNAGIFPVRLGTNSPPAELFEQLNRANLVYYDWEITELRLGQLRETLDLLGTLLTLPQMATNSAARRWVDAAAPKLGNTITELNMTSPQELSLVRRSHVGLNGLELVALANWIESTNFPKIDLSVGFRPPPQTRRMKGEGPAPRPLKP